MYDFLAINTSYSNVVTIISLSCVMNLVKNSAQHHNHKTIKIHTIVTIILFDF
jgi:hypothetical protein